MLAAHVLQKEVMGRLPNISTAGDGSAIGRHPARLSGVKTDR